jgi:hypothetical protein
MSKTIVNPFQDTINWLRSDEGQQWSEDWMQKAKFEYHENGRTFCNPSPVEYSDKEGPLYLSGVLCMKED